MTRSQPSRIKCRVKKKQHTATPRTHTHCPSPQDKGVGKGKQESPGCEVRTCERQGPCPPQRGECALPLIRVTSPRPRRMCIYRRSSHLPVFLALRRDVVCGWAIGSGPCGHRPPDSLFQLNSTTSSFLPYTLSYPLFSSPLLSPISSARAILLSHHLLSLPHPSTA